MPEHRHLHRLSRVWVSDPVYFITTCTRDRRALLAKEAAAAILRDEWQSAASRHGWRIGRYVIMPDHVHFFCAEQPGGAVRNLSRFLNQWKTWTAHHLVAADPSGPPMVWQQGFFDHVLRSEESYAEKWLYVRENPVRAGLAARWEDWSWQGFVDFDAPR